MFGTIPAMTPLEISGNALNLFSVYFAAQNRILTWSIGIAGCILYGFMFFEAKLYADVTLQIFFIATSLYGWWNWTKGGDERKELPVTRVKGRTLALYFIAGIVTTALYGWMLFELTDASYPFIDSIVLMFSVIAQFLLMSRKLENWIFWLVVNTVAVPLYATKGLYLTSAIYVLFWFNAVWGFYKWRRLVGRQA